MLTTLRRLLILVVGIGLLVGPTMLRDQLWHYNARSYTAPDVPELSFAATPLPTATAVGLDEPLTEVTTELRAGPVVVDLAHFNFLNPSSFQPLADALADRGIGLRLWLSPIDAMSVVNYLEFPDQSADLAEQLKDASALVVVSPYFLWSAKEIAMVEQFVADGGRLLLISDPDIMGDYAAATNMIGEPFGVVFNDDYLYDTTTNDGNYTFFFQAAVPAAPDDQSADLTDATIAFYGGRSLSGDVQAQLRTIDTTLSSLRTGSRNFTTAAVGGLAARNTAGRVLALSDFDVLTEPYRTRHDNQRLVEFVADFLSAAERVNRVVDFPNYLGRQVSLAFGASSAINADLILQGAQIQQALEQSGRTLELTDGHLLTGTTSLRAGGVSTATDLIYLADYTTAVSKTLLLPDLGIELFTEVVTETVPVAPEPTSTPTATPTAEPTEEPEASATSEGTATEPPPGADDDVPPATLAPEATLTLAASLTPPATLTSTRPFTATDQLAQVATPTPRAAPTVAATETVTTEIDRGDTITATATLTTATTVTGTAAVEERVIITTYVRTQNGLIFLADETVLVVRTEQNNGRKLLAVLAASNRGIDAGVNRLLTNDFSGCVIGESLTFCSLPASSSGGGSTPGTPGATPTPSPGGSVEAPHGTTTPTAPAPPRGADAPILLIDDNAAATQGEISEADIYLQPLVEGGYQVDLWSVADQGTPTLDDLITYGWVIWSNAGYTNGEIDGRDLDTIFAFVGVGGRLTISSRIPLPGLEERAPLQDVVTSADIPALVTDLPTAPIAITGDDTTAAVLNALSEEDESSWVVLRRGPASENAEAPVMVVLADSSEAEGDARLIVGALSLSWLPADESKTLVNNMAAWMLTE